MARRARSLLALFALVLVAFLCGTCGKSGNDVAGPENTLKVTLAGTGQGRVMSPYGTIDCPSACGPYDWTPGVTVPLVAVPDAATSVFAGWSGAGTGTEDTCWVTVAGHVVVTATFNPKPGP